MKKIKFLKLTVFVAVFKGCSYNLYRIQKATRSQWEAYFPQAPPMRQLSLPPHCNSSCLTFTAWGWEVRERGTAEGVLQVP